MSEENKSAVQPWKPEDAVNQLKERIRLEFAQMIPAEQFAEMVRAVITEFTRTKERGYQGQYRERYSDFDGVVLAELTEATKTEVKKFLEGPQWRGQWDSGTNGQLASERVGELLKEHGPEILNRWIGQAMQHVVQNLINR